MHKIHDGKITNKKLIWQDKPVLSYIEYEVTRKCNLRCKGCSHFVCIDENSNQVPLIEDYRRDLECLSRKYSNISTIRLLGGEPFLADNLEEYLLVSRKIFPGSNVRIATNGLLLKTISNNLLRVIFDTNAYLDITLYPQFNGKKNEIIEWVQKNELNYSFDETFLFYKYLSNRNNKMGDKIYQDCDMRHCHYLSDGKLSRCPLPLIIYRLNDKFGTNYPVDDYLDIYRDDLSAWEINKFLSISSKLCNYCLEKPEQYTCKQIKNPSDTSLNNWVK